MAVSRAAMLLLGAERVIVIGRFDYRLQMTERHIGAETINYTRTSVAAELREHTGGRGPDVCIEAVGMEGVREAIHACRKGGTVFVLASSPAWSTSFRSAHS